MTIQQLRYAIVISETGSFNKASELLYVSQPSLTSAMQELEKELGVTIFYNGPSDPDHSYAKEREHGMIKKNRKGAQYHGTQTVHSAV